MLREITPVRSFRGTRRRWFSDADMDLFVWLDNQMPVRFQLSWNKQNDEHALSWDRNHGFGVNRVDNGETAAGEYNMSPLLLPADAPLDALQLATRFLRASEHIDPMLADFIYARLLEYPRTDRQCASHHTAATAD